MEPTQMTINGLTHKQDVMITTECYSAIKKGKNWLILQDGWIGQTLCCMEEARHRKLYKVRPLRKMSSTANPWRQKARWCLSEVPWRGKWQVTANEFRGIFLVVEWRDQKCFKNSNVMIIQPCELTLKKKSLNYTFQTNGLYGMWIISQ